MSRRFAPRRGVDSGAPQSFDGRADVPKKSRRRQAARQGPQAYGTRIGGACARNRRRTPGALEQQPESKNVPSVRKTLSSYHNLGRVKFSEAHNLDIPAIILRLTSVASENERITTGVQG